MPSSPHAHVVVAEHFANGCNRHVRTRQCNQRVLHHCFHVERGFKRLDDLLLLGSPDFRLQLPVRHHGCLQVPVPSLIDVHHAVQCVLHGVVDLLPLTWGTIQSC